MQIDDSAVFRIPSYARQEAYAFSAPKEGELYLELSAISEEIMSCRARALNNY